MKVGVGVDITRVERFRNLEEDKSFLRRVFTKNELDYCLRKSDPAESLAARFAGKEAVVKALSQLNIKAGIADVEITGGGRKPPKAKVNGLKAVSLELSLSHERDYAVSFAVAFREKDGGKATHDDK